MESVQDYSSPVKNLFSAADDGSIGQASSGTCSDMLRVFQLFKLQKYYSFMFHVHVDVEISNSMVHAIPYIRIFIAIFYKNIFLN